jgi:hypothetical protein
MVLLSFSQALKTAKDFGTVLALAVDADEAVVRLERGITASESRKVRAVVVAAEKYINGDFVQLEKLAMSFSSYPGRLLAIEAFIKKNGVKNASLAVSLAELITSGNRSVSPDLNPKGAKLIKMIMQNSEDFIKPTAKSTAKELADMAKLIKVPAGSNDEPSPKSVAQAEKIAELAKKFVLIDDVVEVAEALPTWRITNDFLLNFLEKVGIKTVYAGQRILAATRISGVGCEKVINKAIRQIVANCPEDTDIANLLIKSRALKSDHFSLLQVSPKTVIAGRSSAISELLSQLAGS